MMEAPLNGFLMVIMSWCLANPSCLFFLEINSFRQFITHKFLSSYTLYSNLSGGVPFLERLSASVGKNVTNRSFRTILLILNSLIVLSLRAPSSSSRTISVCVKIISNNEELYPCCSKYLNKVSTSHAKLSFGFGGL